MNGVVKPPSGAKTVGPKNLQPICNLTLFEILEKCDHQKTAMMAAVWRSVFLSANQYQPHRLLYHERWVQNLAK